MELAVIFDLDPPASLEVSAPITYTCRECQTSIMSYNVQDHAYKAHGSDLFVLKNFVPSSVVEATENPPDV